MPGAGEGLEMCAWQLFCFTNCFFYVHKRHFLWREWRNTGRYREEDRSCPHCTTYKEPLLRSRSLPSLFPHAYPCPCSFLPVLLPFFPSCQHIMRTTQNTDRIFCFFQFTYCLGSDWSIQIFWAVCDLFVPQFPNLWKGIEIVWRLTIKTSVEHAVQCQH